MKKDIKSLVANQIVTKSNRKTVNFTGKRIMEAWDATYQVVYNREELRDHYIAYAILRFKDPIDHLGKSSLEDFPGVQTLLEKYKDEEETVHNNEE